jgi:tRNA (guanine37-N1)-methyltransferase
MKNVKVVFDQEGGIEGDFRLRRLRHLAGEERTLTMHRENMLRFKVDVEQSYFSPRLSTERARIAEAASDGEVILNMFAGVGPYSITLARRKRVEVYSCELNEAAYLLHLENNKLNKVERAIRTFNKDAMELPALLGRGSFDRILMPHPSQSDRFLGAAVELLKKRTGEGAPGAATGWIHYYRHVSGADLEEAESALRGELREKLGAEAVAEIRVRRVRVVGPRYLELVADIRLGAPT